MLASMVVGIVQHDDRMLPPVVILRVQMIAELGQEKSKGKARGHPYVDCVEEVPITAACGDQVHSIYPFVRGDQVLAGLANPSSLPMICVPDD